MAVLGEDDSFSFCPSNDRLVDHYLRAKLDGKISDLANAAYFVDADVCSARPQELVIAHSKPARVPNRDAGDGKQWYFFSPVRFLGSSLKKKSRTIAGTDDKESWHAEGRPKLVEGSNAGGYVQKFSYHVRIEPQIVEKPGWIMAEYSFKDTRDGDTVLCKVYKSPRGPGRSKAPSSSSCKRKAADDLEGAAPSVRPREANKEDDDDVMLLAGDIERNLLSVEQHAAAPEFGEAQNMAERQLEPQLAPASFHGNPVLAELYKLMKADEDAGMTLQVPDGEDPAAYYWRVAFGNNEQQDAAVQTVHGTLTDLLSVEHHAAAPEFGETKHVEESPSEQQIVPASFHGNPVPEELYMLMMTEVDDGTTLQVPDGEDPAAYYWRVLFGNNEEQDAAVQTSCSSMARPARI